MLREPEVHAMCESSPQNVTNHTMKVNWENKKDLITALVICFVTPRLLCHTTNNNMSEKRATACS